MNFLGGISEVKNRAPNGPFWPTNSFTVLLFFPGLSEVDALPEGPNTENRVTQSRSRGRPQSDSKVPLT